MADTKTVEETKITEDQVKQSNALEEQRWQDDFSEEQLAIPYKKEAETPAEEPEEEKEEVIDEEVEVDTEYVPVTSPQVEDPGEYVPKDYSFEIEIDGKKHKVDSADKADELADEYAEKLTAKQLGQLIRNGYKIEVKQEQDKQEYDKKKAQFDAVAVENEAREEYNNQIANEIQYLIDNGSIPKAEETVMNRWLTDPNAWKDKEFIKNPGIREQVELLNRLAKERETRQKAGLNPMVSALEVYKDMQLEQANSKSKVKAEGEQRKAMGARVAGVSPSEQQPFVPKGIAVGNPNLLKRSASVWDD